MGLSAGFLQAIGGCACGRDYIAPCHLGGAVAAAHHGIQATAD